MNRNVLILKQLCHLFKKSNLKLIQYNEYLVSSVDTDGLVFQHQGISSQDAKYAHMCFQLFMH